MASCPLCRKRIRRRELEGHMRQELAYARWRCRHCAVSFFSYSQAEDHFEPDFSTHPGEALSLFESLDKPKEKRVRDLLRQLDREAEAAQTPEVAQTLASDEETGGAKGDEADEEEEEPEPRPKDEPTSTASLPVPLPPAPSTAPQPPLKAWAAKAAQRLGSIRRLPEARPKTSASDEEEKPPRPAVAAPEEEAEEPPSPPREPAEAPGEDALRPEQGEGRADADATRGPQAADDNDEEEGPNEGLDQTRIDGDKATDPDSASSSTKRKRMKCAKCGKGVDSSRLRRHAAVHADRPLFSCLLCTYSSSSNGRLYIKLHIKSSHPGSLTFSDNRQKYRAELESMKRACFESSQLSSRGAAGATIVDPQNVQMEKESDKDDQQSEDADASDASSGKRRKCQLCSCLVNDKPCSMLEHMAAVHSAPQFRCTICSEGLRLAYASRAKAHFKARHPGAKRTLEDLRPGLREELRQLRSRCFPDVKAEASAEEPKIRPKSRQRKRGRLSRTAEEGDEMEATAPVAESPVRIAKTPRLAASEPASEPEDQDQSLLEHVEDDDEANATIVQAPGRVLCAKCGRVMKTNKTMQHAAVHAKLPLFRCLQCPHTSASWQVATIKVHLKMHHPGTTDFADDRLKFTEALEAEQFACFGITKHGRITGQTWALPAAEVRRSGQADVGESVSSVRPEASAAGEDSFAAEGADAPAPSAKAAKQDQCKICSKSVMSYSKMDHVATHASLPLFVCSVCGHKNRSYRNGSIKVHMKARHGGSEAFVENRSKFKAELRAQWEACFGATADGAAEAEQAAPVEEEPKAMPGDETGDANKGGEESEERDAPDEADPEAQSPAAASPGSPKRLRCDKCGVSVKPSSAMVHAATHVKLALFRCPRCPYESTSWDNGSVKRHMSTSHPGEKGFVDDRRKHIGAMAAERLACFGQTKSRFRFGPRSAEGLSNDDKGGAQAETASNMVSKDRGDNGKGSGQLDKDQGIAQRIDDADATQSPLAGKVNCQLCQESFACETGLMRHVAKTHSEKAWYRCNLCQTDLRLAFQSQARPHFKSEHGGAEVDVEDLRPAMAAQVEELRDRCFPDEKSCKKAGAEDEKIVAEKPKKAMESLKCSLCSKVTSHLSRHASVHADLVFFSCQHCDFVSKSLYFPAVIVHMRNAHSGLDHTAFTDHRPERRDALRRVEIQCFGE